MYGTMEENYDIATDYFSKLIDYAKGKNVKKSSPFQGDSGDTIVEYYNSFFARKKQ